MPKAYLGIFVRINWMNFNIISIRPYNHYISYRIKTLDPIEYKEIRNHQTVQI